MTRDLFCADDFELTGAGELREANPEESVRQEISRLAEERDWVAAAMTPGLAATIAAEVLELLRDHPDVADPGTVDVVQEDGFIYIKATFDGTGTEVRL